MIKVMIVDGHLLVRQGLRLLLSDCEGIGVVAEAAGGPDAMPLVRAWCDANDGPGLDVVLLDIALPGRGGLEVLKQIKAEVPALPVLMLSTYPDRQFAVRCIRAGASGCLNKGADPGDIVAAVRQVA